MRIIIIALVTLALVSCFGFDMYTPNITARVIDGPLTGGEIESGTHQCIVLIENSTYEISAGGSGVLLDGADYLYFDETGYHCFTLDTAGLIAGDTFTLTINGDDYGYEVI